MTPPKQTSLARSFRKRDTWAEKLLWTWLRDRRFTGYKFRRQHAFGPHILDFFCVEAFVNIELDGGGHVAPSKLRKTNNGMSGSKRAESKCCVFGTVDCAVRNSL